jgi:hypothetical protein
VNAGYLETEGHAADANSPARADRDSAAGPTSEISAPAPTSAGLVAGSMLAVLLPIPFIFANGPLWAVQRLLPPLRVVGWTALAAQMAIFALCCVSKPLRAPAGVLTYRLSYLYGGIAWLSGLALTYLFWGVGAVFAGIVWLGGGVVTTGLLSTLARRDWQRFLPLFLFVVLTFAARRIGMKLARQSAAGFRQGAEPPDPSPASMGGRS